MKTLEEAILHCEEVADRCDVTDGDRKCVAEHRQLAAWLKELKHLRSKWIRIDSYGVWFYQCPKCKRLSDRIENFCPSCGMKMRD